MRARRFAQAIVLVTAMLAVAGPAWAQLEVGSFRLDGNVEAGGGLFIEKASPSREAKLFEYRDLPEGLFLDSLRLRLYQPSESYSSELWGFNWGRDDQEYLLQLERLGLWQAGFEWNQSPHILSTTGRFMAVETSPGVFQLPTPRPIPLSVHSAAEELGEIGVRWDTARLWFELTPLPELTLRAEYTRVHKDGTKPFGMAFGSPGGNFYEILQPIDQTVQDFRLTGTWAGDRWQIQGGYVLSMFRNELTGVTVDNPCFARAGALPGGCGASDGAAAAPSRGRVSLPPDNIAHTFFLSGGVSLPLRSRLTANFGYSLQMQDEGFMPHTINPAIVDPTLALPAQSLDGLVQTILFNVSGVTRPIKPLTLTLKYRVFDYDDKSDTLTLPGHVVNDRTLVVDDRTVERTSYTRHNADLDARWAFGSMVSVGAGGGWERWDRTKTREVQESDEFFGKAYLDATPFDWLMMRLTYRPAWRRIGHYDTFAHVGHTVAEDPVAAAQFQSVLLRKFDEADRNRQGVALEVAVTPIESLTISPSLSFRHDDYKHSSLGLQTSTSASAGLDLSWRPTERLGFFAGYLYEQYDSRMRSRSRPVTGTTTFDFPDFDWVTDIVDTVNTVYVGVDAILVPRLLDLKIQGTYENATGTVDNANPITPFSGTAAQDATATVQPWPTFKDQYIRVQTDLRYRFYGNWSATLRYFWEAYQKNDWRTDRLQPFTGVSSSIWQGNDLRNFTAHWLGLIVGYSFR